MKKATGIFLLVLLLFPVTCSQFAFAGDFRIEQVTKSIYRFVADRHRSVFLVTEKGRMLLITFHSSRHYTLPSLMAFTLEKQLHS